MATTTKHKFNITSFWKHKKLYFSTKNSNNNNNDDDDYDDDDKKIYIFRAAMS